MEVEIIQEDWTRGKEFKGSWLPSEGIDSFLDLELAGKLVIQAIEQQERIALVTDYDCDGICSAVMSRKFFLDYLGYKNIVTIVNRRNWGNGLNQHLLENIITEYRESKIGLAISFDHTIGNEVEIAKLKNATSMKYVLTDHHSITKVYPKSADVVINVMREDNHFLNGMKSISGCHTGYLLCVMIYKLLDKDVQDLYPLSLYSGITTVVDQMDMNHEYNARVVRSGMRSCDIKEPSCKGLITQLDLPLILKNKNLGWGIGPYINSGNRCNLEPEVFTSVMEADERCYQVAILENKRKKEEQKELVDQAMEEYKKIYTTEHYGVVLEIDSLYGIAGVVASQIGELVNRPCIVLRSNPEHTVLLGSGRGIWPELDLLKIVQKIQQDYSDVVIRAAGHSGACGIELDSGKLDIFRKLFSDGVKEAIQGKIPSKKVYAYPIDSKDIHLGLALRVEEYGPYGKNWEPPCFISKLTYNKSYSIPGGKICIWDRGVKSKISGAFFYNSELHEGNWSVKIQPNVEYEVVFEYQLGYRKGKYSCDMNILDIRRAT